jgi:hypothetical protein
MLIILKNTNSLCIENLLLAYSKDVIISVCYLKYVNKKGNCKNCGDDITDESDSNEFCSEQCQVEYQLEHHRK